MNNKIYEQLMDDIHSELQHLLTPVTSYYDCTINELELEKIIEHRKSEISSYPSSFFESHGIKKYLHIELEEKLIQNIFRPDDFLEVGTETELKAKRFWEVVKKSAYEILCVIEHFNLLLNKFYHEQQLIYVFNLTNILINSFNKLRHYLLTNHDYELKCNPLYAIVEEWLGKVASDYSLDNLHTVYNLIDLGKREGIQSIKVHVPDEELRFEDLFENVEIYSRVKKLMVELQYIDETTGTAISGIKGNKKFLVASLKSMKEKNLFKEDICLNVKLISNILKNSFGLAVTNRTIHGTKAKDAENAFINALHQISLLQY